MNFPCNKGELLFYNGEIIIIDRETFKIYNTKDIKNDPVLWQEYKKENMPFKTKIYIEYKFRKMILK